MTSETVNTLADVRELRAVKHLMDVGLRPGKVIKLSLRELNEIVDALTPPRRDAQEPSLERDVLNVLETVTPLNQAVVDDVRPAAL